ncbi:hypothetical protein P20480_3505 [Pseudoalteromonas sp. BSi20480]|nr:hypothetical protein P20480_3505 [Pseudoalteromonas sp. BSi20480]
MIIGSEEVSLKSKFNVSLYTPAKIIFCWRFYFNIYQHRLKMLP